MQELNHNAGKGDKERSAGWRKNYEAINFPPSEGFARRGNKQVKVYGAPGKVAVFKIQHLTPPELGLFNSAMLADITS